MLALSALTYLSYTNNYALEFSGAQYVRVTHDSVMDGPLLDSWTVEAWVFAEPPSPPPPGAPTTRNIVGFPTRHPSLELSAAGRAYTQVRAIDGSWHGLEGSVPIADGAWHHMAATWDGTAQEPTLSLYVDGVLEMIEAGSRHPARSGYTVASRCTAGLCENGMQIGGFYQSGGGGFTGQFFHGLIDEVRVWSRPRTADEIRAAMGVPLAAADDSSLLFYFPFDDAGMETPPAVVESRAYPWFGLLGNSSGAGRPAFVASDAPIDCPYAGASRARPCTEAGAGNTRPRSWADGGDESFSLLELVVAAVLAAGICASAAAALVRAEFESGYGLARVARQIAEMPAAMKAGGGDSGAYGVTAVADDGTPTSG